MVSDLCLRVVVLCNKYIKPVTGGWGGGGLISVTTSEFTLSRIIRRTSKIESSMFLNYSNWSITKMKTYLVFANNK